MRVLVLRPQPAAARTAARLAAAGHEAIIAPVLAVVGVRTPVPEGHFDLIVATSAQAFVHCPAVRRETRVLAVGARGVSCAQEAGFTRVESGGPDAQALAGRLCALPPGRVLYLAGRDRKPDLEARLHASGVDVVTCVVYAAEPVAHLPATAAEALENDAIDAVLHYSRRSAETFCALALDAGFRDLAASLRHVVISPDAADGLAALAPARVRIAAHPDEASMLAALA